MKIILNKLDEEFSKELLPIISAKFKTAQITQVDDLATLKDIPHLIITEDLSFFDKLTIQKKETSFVVLMNNEDVKKNDDFVLFSMKFKSVSTLKKPFTILEISALIYDLLSSFVNIVQPKINFCPIKIELLKRMNNLPCDLYVKLSDSKTIKVANKGDPHFQEDILVKYAAKGIEFMYVLDSEFKNIETSILEKLAMAMKLNVPPVEKGAALSKSVVMIAKDFGVSEVLLDSINTAYSSSVAELQKLNLGSLIEKLNKANSPFLTNHSHMTSIFSMIICKQMNWNVDKIRNNFCMASLLHDLPLADIPDVTYEYDSTLEAMKKQKPEYQKIIFDHSKIISEKLSTNDKIPSDVITLISKHHEGRGEKSFPLGLHASNLAPLNFLFNVAHQFAIELYGINFNQERMPEAFANLRAFYTSPNFKPYIDILENETFGRANK